MQNNVYTEPGPVPADIPIRIYSNPICPFAQRVRLVAAAKGVPTEEINIHLKVKPQWFLDKINSYGQVPVIEHQGKIIRESLIAFDYIDTVFGEGSLWPEDPYRKAMAQVFIDDFGKKFIPNYYKHYGDEFDEVHTKEVVGFIEKIEGALKMHSDHFSEKNPHLGGKGKPHAVDYIVWPWLERLEPMSQYRPNLGSLITKEKFPLFFDYVDRMKKDDAVKQSYLPPEAHLAFLKAMKSGVHDYSTADVKKNGITIYTKKQE